VKILKVSQAYYPFLAAGGPPTKIRAIATRLAQHGHAVTVLTADLGLRQNGYAAANLKLDRWGWTGQEDGVEGIYLPTFERYRSLTLNPNVIGFCREVAGTFDLAHLYGVYDLLGPPIARSCSRRGTPYVIEPMGMYRPIVRNLYLKKLYHRVLGDRLMREARYVIATSEQERQELAADGIDEARIVIRRNGIEAPAAMPAPGKFRERFAISQDAPLILFLGRMVEKKSPDILIAAFARWRVTAGAPARAVLAIAGPPEDAAYARRLREQCAELRLADAVRFTGPLYGEEKWQAFGDADVFVLPSQNENFGNTAAEAAACGTPVIVTNHCGISPWIEGRAGLVVPHDVEAIEKALASLFSAPALRERFLEGCAAMTRELSWDQPVAQMESLYRQCLEHRPSR
jgi:glycosyltransferase involved in cell wall biosynthesis